MNRVDHNLPQYGSWPENPTHVPNWIYTDPEIFDREMERIFLGPTWHFMGLECELAEPGMWKRGWVGTRSVIAARDKVGEIHVVENRCSHRGAPICWKEQGSSNSLNCPYHQWRFNLQGDLIGVPFENGVGGSGGMPEGFDKKDHGLTKLRVAVRGGAIWASFASDGPDFESAAGPDLLAALDRIAQRPLKPLGVSRQVYASNWKTWMENARDGYHATLLHTFLTKFQIVRADLPPPQTICHDGNLIGRSVTQPKGGSELEEEVIAQISSFKADYGLHDRETVETDRPDHADGLNVGFQLFPNTMFQPQLNVPSYRQIVPRSVDSHEVHWHFFGYEDDDEAMTRRRLKQTNLFGPAGFVTAEDGEVITRMQRVLESTPDQDQVVAMGFGRESANTIFSERPIRDFYMRYRRAMDL